MLTGHCTEGQLELWLEGETQLLPRPPVPAAGTGSLSGLTAREDHALCVTATAPAFTHMGSGIINSKPHPSHGLSGQNTCGRAGTARGSLPGLLKPLMPSALRKTQMTRMSHKTTLQEHHTPALQISTCKSVTAHLGITNRTGSLCRPGAARIELQTQSLTSEATEASFFVVLADVRLVVPPHRGPQVLRSADGTFSERVGQGSGRLSSCSGESPWGPGRNQTLDSLRHKKAGGKSQVQGPNRCLWGWRLSFSVVPVLGGSSQRT